MLITEHKRGNINVIKISVILGLDRMFTLKSCFASLSWYNIVCFIVLVWFLNTLMATAHHCANPYNNANE